MGIPTHQDDTPPALVEDGPPAVPGAWASGANDDRIVEIMVYLAEVLPLPEAR